MQEPKLSTYRVTEVQIQKDIKILWTKKNELYV